MNDDAIKKRTQKTAKKLFGTGIKMGPPYMLWKEFDKGLANDFSLFITGNLYSRAVLTLQERQMVACAFLAATRSADELKLHCNAALNVGCDPRKLAEVFFPMRYLLRHAYDQYCP
jgi:4-carboxymuconolactone decarboxylase